MSASNVAIIAPAALTKNRMFDPAQSRDKVLERFKLLRVSLRERGIDCRTADMFAAGDIDVLIFHDIMNELAHILAIIKSNPGVRLIYIPNEPPFVVPLHDEKLLPRLPVDLVLTWNDRIADRFGHVHKLNIGQPLINPAEIPHVPFAEKEFICSIFAFKPPGIPGTLFEERLRAVEFFGRQECGIDLFGIGWEAAKLPLVASVYRGPVDNKLEIQQRYKFSVAFENTKSFPGLITEKIFDCFAAGSVPIYLGAPNIGDYIPAECFIDLRDYTSYEQLHGYLAGMSESRYREYLAAARSFLGSPAYHQFTSSNFAQTVTRKICGLSEPRVRRSILEVKWNLSMRLLSRPGLLRNWRRFRQFFIAMATAW